MRLIQTSNADEIKKMNTQRNWIKCVKKMSSNKPELVYITWNIVIYQDIILDSWGYWTETNVAIVLRVIHYTTESNSIWRNKSQHSEVN